MALGSACISGSLSASFWALFFRGLCLGSSLGGRTRMGVPVPGRSYFLAVPADGGSSPRELFLQSPLPPPWVPPWVSRSSPASSSAPLRPLVGSLSWLHWLHGGLPSRMGAVSVTYAENLPSFSFGDFSPFFLSFSYFRYLTALTFFLNLFYLF